MKTTINLLLFLVMLQSCNGQMDNTKEIIPNFIDSIQTEKQIENLIAKVNERYKYFKVNKNLKFYKNECKKLSDSLKIKPWQKADFDQNGLTDILVIGKLDYHSILCILDKGKDKYEIKPITNDFFQECSFPFVKSYANSSIIEYYFQRMGDRLVEYGGTFAKTSLIYKFDDFIELNENPTKHKIEKIEFSTSGCYGTCPIFVLTINKDKTSTWKAQEYNEINEKEFKGVFKTTIFDDEYREVIDLLNYIDFEKLGENYAVKWTDDQSCTLKIIYDNGKIKSINDYGLLGTFGLHRIYELLFSLRENQKWSQ